MSEGPQTLRSSPYTPTRGEGYSLDSDPNMDSGHKDSWHVMHRVSGPQHADAPGCARGCCEARRGRAAAETGEQRHEVTNPKQPSRRGQAKRRAHASLRSESVLGSRERHVSCVEARRVAWIFLSYVPQLKKNQKVVSYESWAKIALCDFQDLYGIGINEVKRAFHEHLKTRSKRKDI